VKRLTGFLQEVLIDLGTWCDISTTQDCKTVLGRFDHEGLPFLAVTLASFGKDFQKSLDRGFVAPDAFPEFRKRGGLPVFLRGFLELVFEPGSGRLLPEPKIEAIWAVRQFTLMWAKIELPFTDEEKSAAFDGFKECEQDVRKADQQTDPGIRARYNRLGRLLWGDLFSRVDREVYDGEIYPGHGPGATADHLAGNGKWEQREWPARLDEVFPHWEHLVNADGPDQMSSLADVVILDPGSERPVRVVCVPKSLGKPRVIAIEPAAMQYMQQALLGSLREAIEASDTARWLIGIEDQVPNQHLALDGSRNGATATLDLSEASDRVSNQHVRDLLQLHPHLAAGVEACRSRKADLPGHGIIRLAKFASMGSALCFPMEMFVFATIIFVGIEESLGRPLTKKDISSFEGQVRVFGDDLIVPTHSVSSVIAALEAFGLKVNASKSFWTGKFRESCGMDYYDGHNVNVVRLRQHFPSSRRDGTEIISTISLRNQLYSAGMWRSVRYLDDLLEGLIPFPRVSETSPIHGRHSFLGPDLGQRLCPNLHVPLVKGLLEGSKAPVSRLDGYPALMKCLMLLRYPEEGSYKSSLRSEDQEITERLPASDVEHLDRCGRPKRVITKLGWASAV